MLCYLFGKFKHLVNLSTDFSLFKTHTKLILQSLLTTLDDFSMRYFILFFHQFMYELNKYLPNPYSVLGVLCSNQGVFQVNSKQLLFLRSSQLSGQDREHNLWGPVQNENEMPLVQQLLRISGWFQQALSQIQGPSECSALCDCTGCTPTKLALQVGRPGVQAQ